MGERRSASSTNSPVVGATKSATAGLKRMCRSQRYDPWFQYAKRYAATKYSRLSSHLRTWNFLLPHGGATTERCLCMCMNFAISQFRNDGVNAVRWHRLENHMCAPTHALGKLTLRPARLDRLLVSPYHQCAKPLQQQKRGTTMAVVVCYGGL